MAKDTPADGTLEYGNMMFNTGRNAMDDYYRYGRDNVVKSREYAIAALDEGADQFASVAQNYLTAGQGSMDELNKFLGIATDTSPALTGQQIQDKLANTPGYKFSLDQGQQAMERTQAAKGLLGSGNALIEAQKYGQGLAQNTYQNHINNLMQLNQQSSGVVNSYLGNLSSNATNKANIFQNSGATLANLYANEGNNMLQGYTQQSTSNIAYAMQQNQLAAAASNNNASSAGSLAGLQAGLLKGSF